MPSPDMGQSATTAGGRAGARCESHAEHGVERRSALGSRLPDGRPRGRVAPPSRSTPRSSSLFGAPADLLRGLVKAYQAGCSAHNDQGKAPPAIERPDHKGRLPSMLAPKSAMSYGDTLGEAYVRGPAYYYWASRVATAERGAPGDEIGKDRGEAEIEGGGIGPGAQ